MGFSLTLLLLLLLLLLLQLPSRALAIDTGRSSINSVDSESCNFNKNVKTYNGTDLLSCLNELAWNVFYRFGANKGNIIDRSYDSTRQSYYAYQTYAPNYPVQSFGGALANYFGNEILSALLPNGFPIPNLSSLLNFSGISRPNFNIFNALSSIAQYDDLKCVSRILCEVASGSVPGSLSYRQSSTLQGFGTNSLFGLLSAFETSGTSPILTFGRATLLGFTNRGQPHSCYREYSRCPRNADQLIWYLNNHNGGFFRFFSGNGGSYYRPHRYPYRPHAESQYRIVQSNPMQQSFLNLELDPTDTGKFVFDISDNNQHASSKGSFLSNAPRKDNIGRIKFPKDKEEDDYRLNFYADAYDRYANYNFQTESLRKNRKISLEEDEMKNIDGYQSNRNSDYHGRPRTQRISENDHRSPLNQVESSRKSVTERLLNGSRKNYVRFPHKDNF